MSEGFEELTDEMAQTIGSLGESIDACPYLPDKVATLHFLYGPIAGLRYRSLLDKGFRRSGKFIYRPRCAHCNECKVLRVPVESFRPSREQRRVLRRGRERFTIRIAEPSFSPEKGAMYERYLHFQHKSRDTPIDVDQYEQFLVHSCPGIHTQELQLWAGDELAGVGIFDQVDDILSSVYFYFDPVYAKYSPGTYSVLCEIEEARSRQCPYYYLGYYIAPCPAMSYKARFQPCEWKDPDGETWTRLDRNQSVDE